MRQIAALIVAAACGGKGAEPATQPVVPPPVVPARTPGDLGLDCLLQRQSPPFGATSALAFDVPPELTHQALLRYIELEAKNGETMKAAAIHFALGYLLFADDVPGLRAVFGMETAADSDRTSDSTLGRARAGVELSEDMRDWDRIGVARELAVAGDRDAATKLLAQAKPPQLNDTIATRDYVGALAAVGRIDDARAIISRVDATQRLDLIAAWLTVAIRTGGSVTDAMTALIAEMSKPTQGTFTALALLRRAEIAGRLDELGPLMVAIDAWYQQMKPTEYTLSSRWDVARLAGDQPAMALLAEDPLLHHYVSVRTAPILVALAEAFTGKYPDADLAVIWARTRAGTPADRAAFVEHVCPDGGRPALPATPPIVGMKVAASEVDHGMQEECALHDVAITLTGGEPDTEVLTGQCTGACTPEEKREGEAQVKAIEEAIARGEASDSELDYNFTDCQWSGTSVERTERVGGRDVVLLADTFIGPHDIDGQQYQLALAVCGELFVSQAFGRMYMGSFDPSDLTVRASTDQQQIIVSARTDYFDGVLYRLRLPACPAKALESITEVQR